MTSVKTSLDPRWTDLLVDGIRDIISNMTNSVTRISATLPEELGAYLSSYQERHQLESRSAALAEAIRALRERELEQAYRELGEAQAAGLEMYPADNLDGLEQA